MSADQSQTTAEQRIRILAYEAWDNAGRPDGFSHLFWNVGEALAYREQFPLLASPPWRIS